MPRTVHEKTAEWAKEAEREERGDRWNLIGLGVLAGAGLTSVAMREVGWAYLGAALFLAWLLGRAAKKRRRRTR